MVDGARLSAIAPMIAGPRVNPRSRNMLVVALAMPARLIRTVLTATAVTDDTANANPIPITASGAITGPTDRCETGSVEIQKSPIAISANPPPRSHLGFTRGITYEISGRSTSV